MRRMCTPPVLTNAKESLVCHEGLAAARRMVRPTDDYRLPSTPADADPRTFSHLRDRSVDASPGASTAAFFMAAIDAKLVFGFAAPVVGVPQVPSPLFGPTSPISSLCACDSSMTCTSPSPGSASSMVRPGSYRMRTP